MNQALRHFTPSHLLSRPVSVILVGAGGNGSMMATRLARLHLTMLALGHPGGLDVTIVDPDTVSTANIGRQAYYQNDVGLPKAAVLAHRINMSYGLNWKAQAIALGDNSSVKCDILIGCVDTRASRRAIHAALQRGVATQFSGRHTNATYWLDLGNSAHTGQVVLGQVGSAKDKALLPTIVDLYPDLLDPANDGADEDQPSCSLADAIEKQSLYVNDAVSVFAANLLFSLFRNGGLADAHGAFINLESLLAMPLAIDRAAWAALNPAKYRKPRLKRVA